MSKKKKAAQPAPTEQAPAGGLKRTIVTAVRWSAWILVLCLMVTQLTGNMLDDASALGLFVIAGLLYAISMVLERKYKW